MDWDKVKSIEHLRNNAEPPFGLGYCARYVREALEAGGLSIRRTLSAKDYGPHLVAAGFVAQAGNPIPYLEGDVAVIDGFKKGHNKKIKKGHPDGHMAMFDGTRWISDYIQPGIGPYPGSAYEAARPAFVIYRYPGSK